MRWHERFPVLNSEGRRGRKAISAPGFMVNNCENHVWQPVLIQHYHKGERIGIEIADRKLSVTAANVARHYRSPPQGTTAGGSLQLER